jgi:lipoic acid synthetase
MSRWPQPSSGLQHIVRYVGRSGRFAGRGASQFVKVIQALRRNTPETTIEILTPDFRNKSQTAVEAIVEAGPDVYNHNLETVPRLYPTIRPGRALLCFASPCWRA